VVFVEPEPGPKRELRNVIRHTSLRVSFVRQHVCQ
jgi:hypothetical protein